MRSIWAGIEKYEKCLVRYGNRRLYLVIEGGNKRRRRELLCIGYKKFKKRPIKN